MQEWDRASGGGLCAVQTESSRGAIMTRRKSAAWLILWAVFGAGLAAAPTALAGVVGRLEDDAPQVAATRRNDAVGALPFQAVDTVLLILCTAIVLPMIPALGQFYGGMVRRKNVLSTFQQSFILLGVIAAQWVLVGYSLVFGEDALGGFCGGWQWFGLRAVGVEPNATVAPAIPHELFMLFEMLVAVFAAALISGAIAERVKFSSYLVFTFLWTTFVYDPVAHWVWGPGGWIKNVGRSTLAVGWSCI